MGAAVAAGRRSRRWALLCVLTNVVAILLLTGGAEAGPAREADSEVAGSGEAAPVPRPVPEATVASGAEAGRHTSIETAGERTRSLADGQTEAADASDGPGTDGATDSDDGTRRATGDEVAGLSASGSSSVRLTEIPAGRTPSDASAAPTELESPAGPLGQGELSDSTVSSDVLVGPQSTPAGGSLDADPGQTSAPTPPGDGVVTPEAGSVLPRAPVQGNVPTTTISVFDLVVVDQEGPGPGAVEAGRRRGVEAPLALAHPDDEPEHTGDHDAPSEPADPQAMANRVPAISVGAGRTTNGGHGGEGSEITAAAAPVGASATSIQVPGPGDRRWDSSAIPGRPHPR